MKTYGEFVIDKIISATMTDLIRFYIKPAIIKARKEIAKNYDITSDSYKDYAGLCDETTMMVKILLDKSKDFKDATTGHSDKFIVDPLYGNRSIMLYGYNFELIHGELAHTPHARSKFWPYQHTWGKITFRFVIDSEYDEYRSIYIDPTSSQLKQFSKYPIKEYSISKNSFPWLLPDNKNAKWKKGLIRIINDKLSFKRKIKDKYGNDIIVTETFIEFCQYVIWGKISDKIYYLINRNK